MWLRGWILVWLWTGGAACGGGGSELFVDVRTDLVPGEEFTAVTVTIADRVADHAVTVEEGYLDGVRVARFDGVSGDVSIVVSLLAEGRAILTRRASLVGVRGRRAVTLVFTRDCRGIECGDEDALACVAARCVDDRCSEESPEHCPPAECVVGSDCTGAAGCSTPRCEAGVCLYGDGGRCDTGEFCDPDFGCRPRVGPCAADEVACPAGCCRTPWTIEWVSLGPWDHTSIGHLDSVPLVLYHRVGEREVRWAIRTGARWSESTLDPGVLVDEARLAGVGAGVGAAPSLDIAHAETGTRTLRITIGEGFAPATSMLWSPVTAFDARTAARNLVLACGNVGGADLRRASVPHGGPPFVDALAAAAGPCAVAARTDGEPVFAWLDGTSVHAWLAPGVSEPVVDVAATGVDVAVAPDGTPHVLWYGASITMAHARRGDLAWEVTEIEADVRHARLAVDPDGLAHVVFVSATGLQHARLEPGGPEVVPVGGQPAPEPSLDFVMGLRGDALVTFLSSDGAVMYALRQADPPE